MPASLKGGPITTNTLQLNRYLAIYVFLIWVSSLPPLWLMTGFFNRVLQGGLPLTVFLTFPLHLLLWYTAFVFTALFSSWIILKVLNLLHRPREGVFRRSMHDKDFRYWVKRAVVKKFALWLTHNFPIPWADIVAMKMFGVNVTMSTALFDSWVDSEFLTIGPETIIGQGAVVMTSMVTTDELIIKRVTIGKQCVVGAHSVISPGTLIGDNTILGAVSGTFVDQILEPGWVYMGCPAQKWRENQFREDLGVGAAERAKQEFQKMVAAHEDSEALSGRKQVRVMKKVMSHERKALKQELKAETAVQRGELAKIQAEFKAQTHQVKAQKKRQKADEIIKKTSAKRRVDSPELNMPDNDDTVAQTDEPSDSSDSS
jgi:carbonic anhydrase/acetyltransferase-like protein (isoleucine patch superfamily)